jgi:hypothetical protein
MHSLDCRHPFRLDAAHTPFAPGLILPRLEKSKARDRACALCQGISPINFLFHDDFSAFCLFLITIS